MRWTTALESHLVEAIIATKREGRADRGEGNLDWKVIHINFQLLSALIVDKVDMLKNKYQCDLQVKYRAIKYITGLTGMGGWDSASGMVDIPRHMHSTLSKDYKWMLKKPFFHYEAMMELMEGNYATGSYISAPIPRSSVSSVGESSEAEATESTVPAITVGSPSPVASMSNHRIVSPAIGTPPTTPSARNSPVMISPLDVVGGVSSPTRLVKCSLYYEQTTLFLVW